MGAAKKILIFSAFAALVALPLPAVAQAADIALPISGEAGSTATAAPASSAAAPPASDAAAMGAYLRMGQCLAGQTTFFVELASTTTLTVSDREKVTGGLSRVWYRRPDHVVWTTQSDIGSSALSLDGKDATLYLPSLSRYMVSPLTEATFDGQLAAMSAPYGLLTTALFSRDTTTSLQAVLAGQPNLIGHEEVLGVPCDHLAVPTRSGDMEVWIASGPIPLPVQVSSGMKIPASPGQDNAIVSKTDVSFRWKVNVDLPDSVFKLQLPETAQRADKLGQPIVVAKLSTGNGSDSISKSKSSKSSSKSNGSASRKGSSSDEGKDYGLAFEPPPNLDRPVGLPSALNGASGSDNVPSLGSQGDVVAAAIRDSRPDSVPSGASYQPQQDTAVPPPPSSAAKTPQVQLEMLDGRKVDLASYRGRKAVVLDFWATWCGPCRMSLPVVSQVAQTYRNRGVEFFAVNMAEDRAAVEGFVSQNGMGVPVALDSDGRLAATFGVSGIPHLVVIGKDGTVTATHTGADSGLGATLMKELETAVR